MPTDVSKDSTQTVLQGSNHLVALGWLDAETDVFWAHYLQAVGQALTARRVMILASAVGKPWQARSQWPASGAERATDADWTLQLLGQMVSDAPLVRRQLQGGLSLVVTLQGQAAGQMLVLVALDVEPSVWTDASLSAWALLAAAIPLQWQLARGAETSDATATPEDAALEVTAQDTDRSERLHGILRMVVQLQQETRFMAMAMALCNALALRFACERVSLGWEHGRVLELTAVSHVEQFDAKSQATRALEAVMDEALDQDAVLSYPATAGMQDHVLRAHKAYSETLAVPHLTTVPLMHTDNAAAVLCLERNAGVLTDAELWELDLMGAALAPWLRSLHARDRWFGARWWSAMQGWSKVWLQPRHTAYKLAGMVGVLLLLLLTFLPWPYRVDATLAIRSQDLLFMPAPFDGYLRKVHVQVGDQVQPNAILVELDTRDLELEASMSEADWVRHSRESEKALAANQLAEMQISAARALQSAARLEMIQHQLAHAQVRAPYASVVIEGDIQKNLGAPVRKGDLLLKLAQTSNAYLELEIDQASIHEVKVGSRAEFALVGRPQDRFGITIKRIDPAATTRDGRTFYLARADVDGSFRPDWRPGMGGNAKIEAGTRSPLWIMTHRTVRFLREFFWL